MATAERPNLLFVFSDQHRGVVLGCAGNPDVETPALDGLAAQGTRFENACANAPVCTPSRACLLTGQYPLTHRVIGNDLPLPTDAPSVAEAFRDAGYRTGYVGKWHLDGVPREKFTPPGPRRQGFDDFWAAWNCSHDYADARYYRDEDAPVAVEGYEPVEQTDLALEFLDADDERPFCLFLSWGPPHAPYDQAPGEYRERYDPDSLALRPNAEPIPPETSEIAGDLDPRETLANYYAHVTALDDQFGRLLEHLDDAGLREETIVTYTSDHGDMLWSQGKFKKEQPWAESVGVPFVVRYPGVVPAGETEDAPFGLVDAAPSLLALAGIDPPDEMEGEDYSPRLRGEDPPVRDSVFLAQIVRNSQARTQHLPPWRGVRTRRYTYARLHDGTGWLLYDDEEDPYQLHNRVLNDDYAAERERLDALLDEWLERTGDPFVSEEEHVRAVDMVAEWNARFESFPWFDEGDRIDPD
ncbi:MAG: sulfatase [Halobacteriaceae archaeon]